MVEVLKRTNKGFETKFNALNQMYDYLSKHFIHFSSYINPLRTRSLKINSGEKLINIWCIDGLVSLVEILKPLIEYYIMKIEEIN